MHHSAAGVEVAAEIVDMYMLDYAPDLGVQNLGSALTEIWSKWSNSAGRRCTPDMKICATPIEAGTADVNVIIIAVTTTSTAHKELPMLARRV